MRPPLKKRIGLPETPLLEPMPTTDSKAEALEEKRQLAKHLHNQAINPLRWTEAHPASQSDQQTYQATGQKPRGNQFDVKGKLYNWSPDVTATPQQAKAITDAYMAERSGTAQKETGPAIDKLVEVEKVPLTPPFGTPHKNRIANDMNAAEERKALFRHYAQSGVDPDKAHLGDPLPMKDQERLKAEIKKISSGASDPIKAPHASEIAQNHSSPLFYQGFDDKWIYQTNSHTRESDEVQKLRAEHLGETSSQTANDNISIDERIAQHYLDRDKQKQSKNDQPVAEAELNENAAKRLADASEQIDSLVSAIENIQADRQPTEAEGLLLERINGAFDKIGIKFDPKNTNIDYLRTVAHAIKNTASESSTAGKRVPLHILAQSHNVQLAQALAGGTIPWAKVHQSGPSQALALALNSPRKLGTVANVAGTVIAGYALGKSAAEVAKKMAEEDESPNIFSPYQDGGAFTGESTKARNQQATSSADIINKLSPEEIAQIDHIFTGQPSTFDRSQPISMASQSKAEILSSGAVDAIELFGLPIYISDPRGNAQTQSRVDRLKKFVRDKMIECGMIEENEWGGEIEDKIPERAKERFVPNETGGLKGSRRADLSFKVNWQGKSYIIDINTVDVLKSGLMTQAERRAAVGLMLNRLIRLDMGATSVDNENILGEYDGKIGTVPKGKDMSDEEWDEAAKKWVDSFLDCDEPLDASVHLDPESAHPWPGKDES